MTDPERASHETNEDLNALHGELSQTLRQLARQLVDDENRADDLVQEAWVAALDRKPDQVRDLTSWLRQVVRNLAGRSYRRSLRRRDVETLAASTEAVESEAALVDQASTYRMLRSTADELREPQRSIVVARFFEGKSVEEIVAENGTSSTTVRRQIKRGLDDLRAALDRKHEGRRSVWGALLTSTILQPDESSGIEPTAGVEVATKGAGGLNGGLWVVALAASIPLMIWLVPAAFDDGTVRAVDGDSAVVDSIPEPLPRPSPVGREVIGETDSQPTRDIVAADGPPDAEAPKASVPTRRLEVIVSTAEGAPEVRPEIKVWSLGRDGNELFETPVIGDDRGHIVLELPEDRIRSGQDSDARWIGCCFRVRAPGKAWSLTYTVPIPPEGRVVEVSTRGQAFDLSGTVVDGDGRPVQGAVVYVDKGNRSSSSHSGAVKATSFVEPVTTGGEGRFQFDGLPKQVHRLRVSADGFGSVERMIACPDPDNGVPVSADERVVIHAGNRITGRLYLDDGRPAAGAHVWLPNAVAEKRGERIVQTDCDEQGLFELDGVTPGDHHVFATMPDQPEVFACARIDVKEDEPALWDSLLSRTEGLSVQVNDAAGRPVQQAVVVVFAVARIGEDEVPPWADLRETDADGRAHFLQLPAGELAALVQHSIHDPHTTTFPCDRAAGENVFQLAPNLATASITGGVTDELGLLGPGSTLIGSTAEGELFNTEVRTSDGRFEATTLDPGRYEVLLLVDGFGAARVGEISLDAGERLELPPILVPVPQPIELRWLADAPSAESPWILSVGFERGVDRRTVLMLDEAVDFLELFPGPYRLSPFGDESAKSVEFEVLEPSSEAVPVIVVE